MESQEKNQQSAQTDLQVKISTRERRPFKAGADLSPTVNRVTVQVEATEGQSTTLSVSLELSHD